MTRRKQAVISARTGVAYSVAFEVARCGACSAYVDALGVTFDAPTYTEASDKARVGVEAHELRGGDQTCVQENERAFRKMNERLGK